MKTRRVLVAPLDWGLGHATRCIPIIKLLLQKDCEVFLGGSGHSLALLKNEFPGLSFIDLPGYDPYYSKNRLMAFSMLLQLPKFLSVIKNEHDLLQTIVIDRGIDIVISDNRYGCWSPKIKCVFITHQVNILVPKLLYLPGKIINYFNQRQIKKFEECWVPGYPDHVLTGELTTTHLPVRYIGILSRLASTAMHEVVYDILILLSGPEPQRTILETKIIQEVKNSNLTIMLVRGVHGDENRKIAPRFYCVDFLKSEDLCQVIQQARLVISRPGYSTIMDLAKLKKKAFFIPTPGQTEQEYLAVRLKEEGIANFSRQNQFKLSEVIETSNQYGGFGNFDFDDKDLNKAVTELLK